MEKRKVLVKFGKKVREERKKLRLSQEKLAELVVCHRTYVGMVERAEKNLTLSNIEGFAKALKVKFSYLMEGL